MRLRGSLFWGIAFILLAGLLLANSFHLLPGSIYDYFWPGLVILFGLWLIIGAVASRSRAGAMQSVSIPLDNARSARIKLEHGAGRLNVRGGAGTAEVLNGSFGAEAEYHSHLVGESLEVKLQLASQFFSWYPGQTLDWDVALNRDIPLTLKIESGASATVLDLSELKVTDLDVDTGASSTEITLPAHAGHTSADIDTGASSLKITVPAGVAARIRVKGLTAVNIDTARFPRLDHETYMSADYQTAANRADVTIDSGVGSIEIK